MEMSSRISGEHCSELSLTRLAFVFFLVCVLCVREKEGESGVCRQGGENKRLSY